MRTLLKVSIPVEKGNATILDGSLQKITNEALERLKPEASYFLAENGRRTMLLFIDLADPSDIPSIAEVFFHGFNADVTFSPVMNQDDLKKALSKVAQSI